MPYTPKIPTEDIAGYRRGGYHPVLLGDRILIYKIIAKSGYSNISTVWMARDLVKERYVVMEILTAEYSVTENSKYVPNRLRYIKAAEPDKSWYHFRRVLDEFEPWGPNGRHTCLIYEPMGASIDGLLKSMWQWNEIYTIPQAHSDMIGRRAQYPAQMSRSIIKQVLRALALLHKNDIVHGDLNPEHMLFDISYDGDIDTVKESFFKRTDLRGETYQLTFQSHYQHACPRYLYAPEPPLSYTTSENGPFRVKLSNLNRAYGTGFPPPSGHFVRIEHRAPELVFSESVSDHRNMDGEQLDIWDFGCFMFKLITGFDMVDCFFTSKDIIMARTDKTKETQDDFHLLMMSQLLGPLHDDFYEKWTRSCLYFDKNRQLYNCRIGGPDGTGHLDVKKDGSREQHDKKKDEKDKNKKEQGEESKKRVEVQDKSKEEDDDKKPLMLDDVSSTLEGRLSEWAPGASFRKKVRQAKDEKQAQDPMDQEKTPDVMDEEEVQMIAEVLRKIFKYDPAERPTAEQLLKDPWFQGIADPPKGDGPKCYTGKQEDEEKGGKGKRLMFRNGLFGYY